MPTRVDVARAPARPASRGDGPPRRRRSGGRPSRAARRRGVAQRGHAHVVARELRQQHFVGVGAAADPADAKGGHARSPAQAVCARRRRASPGGRRCWRRAARPRPPSARAIAPAARRPPRRRGGTAPARWGPCSRHRGARALPPAQSMWPEPTKPRLFSFAWKCTSREPARRMASAMSNSSMFMWKVSSITPTAGVADAPRRSSSAWRVVLHDVGLEAVERLDAEQHAGIRRAPAGRVEPGHDGVDRAACARPASTGAARVRRRRAARHRAARRRCSAPSADADLDAASRDRPRRPRARLDRRSRDRA